MDVPVSPGRLGHDLYALGNPIDSMGPVEAVKRHQAQYPFSFSLFQFNMRQVARAGSNPRMPSWRSAPKPDVVAACC